ncbi:MAG TPA: DEAD/DEAH box helicase [Mycobacteriales bacterium]|nr:DEAD/DEAH box helicase [Mycobacteriales bacterium]
MATQGRRPVNDGRSASRQRQRPARQEQGPIPVLAKAVHGVEVAVQRGRVTTTTQATFQAVALLVRELREQAKTEQMSDAARNVQMKRIEGIATVLARTAARNSSLLALLTDDAPLVSGSRLVMDELREAGGMPAAEKPAAPAATTQPVAERRVVPQSVVARQLANPFLAPDYSAPVPARGRPRMLAGWELLGPLLRAFETASGGATSCMTLPEPTPMYGPPGWELMPHQTQVIKAAAEGHRTFLLADEPGLGKTAQALLAAKAANAYPLLAVVPNVVKTSWAREAALWTPKHPATVVHSDGETVDAFSDIVVVNYDILDRHVGWLATHGFRGMVVDEAHFIKNKSSLRSRHVLELADRIRLRTVRPLLMALTGTPLINDIEDFLAIWEFLGWINENEPRGELMEALEDNRMTPEDPDFYPAARQAVINLGIVRRRKVEVAADIPARRIADLPVELEGAMGRSIRDAERALTRRLVKRYESAVAARVEAGGPQPKGIDHELVRKVAGWERQDAKDNDSDENVFTLMRRIGQAKAVLAADYAAQLSRNVGKVVFFAKHVDVMDAAEQTFAQRGIRYSSIRGDQTTRVRQKNIDEFVKDDDVAIIVCSLLAAGVGINLQVSSNVVLAELSWTDAEQTQAIDRVHRIGQDQPVTAWRIIAAQTIDARVAELIDSKAGLAARALDGSDEEIASSVDVQLEALVTLLTNALAAPAI